jgi:hypothetical protein
MKPVNLFLNWGAQLVIDRPARKKTIDELKTQLESSAKEMSERLEKRQDSPTNRRQLCHIVGIERWGQRRLRVAIGEPFLAEEYDHYRPSLESTWSELINEWGTTRKNTLALANDLSQPSTLQDLKILHNMYGLLSINGWLRYLDVHARSEMKRIK